MSPREIPRGAGPMTSNSTRRMRHVQKPRGARETGGGFEVLHKNRYEFKWLGQLSDTRDPASAGSTRHPAPGPSQAHCDRPRRSWALCGLWCGISGEIPHRSRTRSRTSFLSRFSLLDEMRDLAGSPMGSEEFFAAEKFRLMDVKHSLSAEKKFRLEISFRRVEIPQIPQTNSSIRD